MKLFGKIFGILIAYNIIASLVGGMTFDWGQFLAEIPIVIFITFLFYKSLKPQTKFPVLIASIPWLLFYFFIDLYLMLFGRVFKLIEVTELPELIDILPFYYLLIGLAFNGFFLFVLFKSIAFKKMHFSMFATVPLILTFTWSFISPVNFYNSFMAVSTKTFIYEDKLTVGNNGRWMTLLYFEAKRKTALLQLGFDDQWLSNKDALEKDIINDVEQRNVHVIVLESYLDPTLLNGIELPNEIVPKSIKALEPYKNLSRSPVFGNRTPQAEFEILCNVPAFHKLSSIDFNLFSGSPTSCLPSWLKSAGWHTTASHAYKPTFFNRANAYQSLQFDDIYFAKDYVPASDTYFETKLDNKARFMFDGDLFEQNLDFIKNYQANNTKPLFNYVLGVYGHWPNERDLEKYPDVYELEEYDSMARVVNEYYYRTFALEKYLNELNQIDPNAIILVISDHLPPMKNMNTVYKDLDYLPEFENDKMLNIYYLFDKGQPIKLDNVVNHYDMASLIKNQLTNDGFVDTRTEQELVQQYLDVLSWAMQ